MKMFLLSYGQRSRGVRLPLQTPKVLPHMVLSQEHPQGRAVCGGVQVLPMALYWGGTTRLVMGHQPLAGGQ